MRPVTKSANPLPDYSEREQRDSDVDDPDWLLTANRPRKRARTTRVTKAELATRTAGLVDIWIGNNLGVNYPVFASEDDAKKFRLYSQSLAGGTNWGAARRKLIADMGEYCSYCTSRMCSNLHVEHILAKSAFPEKAFTYANFLLACPSCNSCKGSRPNQKTISDPAQPTADAAPYILNKDHYLWPDSDWSALLSTGQPPQPPSNLQEFPFQVTLNWLVSRQSTLIIDRALDPDEEQEVQNLFEDGELPVHGGRYYKPTGIHGKSYLAAVISCPGNSAQSAAATALVDLLGLNRVVPSSQAAFTIDRRLETRTKTWFTARVIRRLIEETDSVPALQQEVIKQARSTIRNTGHWLVWMAVLCGNDRPSQMRLNELFQGTVDVWWVGL